MNTIEHFTVRSFDPSVIPEVGKTYFFYDDGKVRDSRQYKVKVTRVVPFDDAKGIPYPFDEDDQFSLHLEDFQKCSEFPSPSWRYIFDKARKDHDWLFDDTDFIVECEYVDENPSWHTDKPYPMLFARSRGGWYTIDPFYNGRLDVDGSLTNELNEY